MANESTSLLKGKLDETLESGKVQLKKIQEEISEGKLSWIFSAHLK